MSAAAPLPSEGAGGRRDFHLPGDDEDFLNRSGLRWETVNEQVGGQIVRRLVIYGFDIPDGYDVEIADLFLRIEPLYPDTQIDMVYFYPDLKKASNGTINNLSPETFDGKTWQRWSRHRTAENPWRPGIDCVETHLHQVRAWLARELP